MISPITLDALKVLDAIERKKSFAAAAEEVEVRVSLLATMWAWLRYNRIIDEWTICSETRAKTGKAPM